MNAAETLKVTPVAPAKDSPVPVRRSETGLTRREAAELAKAEQIILAARAPEYAPKLLICGITTEFLDALETDIAGCRQDAVGALQQTRVVRALVRERLVAQARLMEGLREIQAAARVKFGLKEPLRLKTYAIGVEIDMSMFVLYSCAHLILDRAAADQLPGITPEMLAATQAKLEAWFDLMAEKRDAFAESVGFTERRRQAVKEISARRMQIQLAAGASWRERLPQNEAARTRFYLPLNRPYTG